MALGAPLGSLGADIVRPDVCVWSLLAAVGVALSVTTGTIDLILRNRTP